MSLVNHREYFRLNDTGRLDPVVLQRCEFKYKQYEVSIPSEDISGTLLELSLAARFLDRRSFQALLVVSKELHHFLAKMGTSYVYYLPEPQEVTISEDSSSLLISIRSLEENQFLLVSGINLKLSQGKDETQTVGLQYELGYRYDIPVAQSERFCADPNHFDLALLLNICPFIEKFPLILKDDFLRGDQEFKAQVLRALPFVTDLSLSSAPPIIFNPKTPFRFQTREERAYIKQNYLELIQNQTKGKGPLLEILHAARRLEVLRIRGDSFFSSELQGLEPNSLPYVRFLSLQSGLITASLLKTLLQAAPQIEELDLGDSKIYVDDLFMDLDKDSLPHLKKVILPMSGTVDEEYVFLYGDFDQRHITALQNAAPSLSAVRTQNSTIYQDYKVFFPRPEDGGDFKVVLPHVI